MKKASGGEWKDSLPGAVFCRNEYNIVFVNLTFECYRCKTDVKMQIRRHHNCTTGTEKTGRL